MAKHGGKALVQTSLSASVTLQVPSAGKKNQCEKGIFEHSMCSTLTYYMTGKVLGTECQNKEIKLSLPSDNFLNFNFEKLRIARPKR